MSHSQDQLTLRLNSKDNVIVARAKIAAGTTVAESVITAAEIPAGHKVATRIIAAGDEIRKYDQIIGFASCDIAPGDHVHTHNTEMKDFSRDYAFSADQRGTDYVPESERATFQGYRRDNGSVGTRNYIGVLSSVNCSASAARMIADAFRGDALADFPNVDGVVPIVHGAGCASGVNDVGYHNLQRALWGFTRHPNFGGVLMVGLGCEVNQIDVLLDNYNLKTGERFRTMTIQNLGGTRKTVEHGVAEIRKMLPMVNAIERETVPASELTLALQCGGSDGYSGVTANPALGAAADLLVRHGGTAILSETPEIFGAEHLLTRRAVSKEVGEKLVERIQWWEAYTKKNGGEMNNNPSPGNKAGGLTTILEKSLGAIAKGGTSDLCDVFQYAEPVTSKGFVIMDTPGYDPASITGQVAGGANVICFTTGRGSAYGGKPAPSIKLATNTALYNHMEEDMDINCGVVVDEGVSIEQMGERIFAQILETASGVRTKSEMLGVGDDEFVPWQVGATM